MAEKDRKDEKPAEIENLEIAPLTDDDLDSASGGEAGCTCWVTFCDITSCTDNDDDGTGQL